MKARSRGRYTLLGRTKDEIPDTRTMPFNGTHGGQGKAVAVGPGGFAVCGSTDRGAPPRQLPDSGVFLTMQSYRIYVRLKSAGQAIGHKVYTGSPPARGTELNVPLITGRPVKVRIGSPTTKRSESVGTIVTVYADEI